MGRQKVREVGARWLFGGASTKRGLRAVPESIPRPSYAQTGRVLTGSKLTSWEAEPADVETVGKLRRAGRLAREMLDLTCSLAEEGVSTNEIDLCVHEAICAAGAYPAPLNYMGFPKSICASNNDVCCHGIPNDARLRKGDVVSFDVSLYLDGVFGDNCATVIVGDDSDANPDAVALVDATKRAVDVAVRAVGPGVCLTAVGDAVASLADSLGRGVVRQYCGHGIGTVFHAPPLVQHFRNSDRFLLKPGHVFTIEPILTDRPAALYVEDDGWTVRTRHQELAAQFEHMVLITPHGTEILTTLD